MRSVFSVDPGVKVAGVAYFVNAKLAHACPVVGEDWRDTAERIRDCLAASSVAEWAIELPQVYTQSKWKGDPNDLIQLALVVGALAYDTQATLYRPSEWKKQVPKEIMGKRILERLSLTEREAIRECPARHKHNVLDAIGIGLHHLKRLR